MNITRFIPAAGLASAVLFLGLSKASAEVSVSKIFGDHMVLQQEAPIRIWGAANPGEQVIVGVAGGGNAGNNAANQGAGNAGRGGQVFAVLFVMAMVRVFAVRIIMFWLHSFGPS